MGFLVKPTQPGSCPNSGFQGSAQIGLGECSGVLSWVKQDLCHAWRVGGCLSAPASEQETPRMQCHPSLHAPCWAASQGPLPAGRATPPAVGLGSAVRLALANAMLANWMRGRVSACKYASAVDRRDERPTGPAAPRRRTRPLRCRATSGQAEPGPAEPPADPQTRQLRRHRSAHA